MRRMKVALIHYTFGGVIGGVEFVMAEHARLFAEHGHEVAVFCERSGGSDAGARLLPRDGVAGFLRDALRECNAVFVHNVMTMPFNLVLTAALWNLPAALSETRFVAWVHDLAAGNPDYPLAEADSLLRLAARGFEYVAVSEQRRGEFQRLTGRDATVIPNGIDAVSALNLSDTAAALAEQHHLLSRELVLLCPARLLPRKNLELAIRTVEALRTSGVDACAMITGPPDVHNAASSTYAENLRSATSEHIVFPSARLERRDIASLYSIADALFYPSRQEGFGLPILEAMLHRLPVFCADLPSLRAIAPPASLFFDPDIDPHVLAGAIAAKLAHGSAHGERKQIVRDFSWPAIYTRHLAPLLTKRQPPL